MNEPKNVSAEPPPGLRQRLCELVVGSLFLVCTGLVALHGNQIFDQAQTGLGKRGLLLLVEFLLLASIYFGWKLALATKWKSDIARLEAQYLAVNTELQELKQKSTEQKPTEPQPAETVRISDGVELRKGNRTLGLWMAFCPKCHTPLHPQNWVAKLKCPSGCGWISTIPESDILNIIKKAREGK